VIEKSCVDVLYLACNRLEFTQETFTALLNNTDWPYVHELFVYDDGSVDGTREWLEQNVQRAPAPVQFVKTNFGSPVTAMTHFIESAGAPILAKTDNDAMLPPAWLRQSLEVLDRHPELDMLGIEAMYPHRDEVQPARSYTPAQFVSGLGLYRRAAFSQSRPRAYDKWFGLEEWQMAHSQRFKYGWITPALPVFLLDRFPFDPWRQYSEIYIQRGWQRSWPKYDSAGALWHWRWPPPTPITPAIMTQQNTPPAPAGQAEQRTTSPVNGHAAPPYKIIILSARAPNLVPCVQSILKHEPALPAEHIIVVDDGARREAEAKLPPLHWVPGVKPFIYARNANLGIRAAGTDVILLNDDARLLTPGGFTKLAQFVREQSRLGVCSAGIRGVAGNPQQISSRQGRFRLESKTLAFICVYIPQVVYERVGWLDEQFNGYGFEDNDYCARLLAADWQLGIWESCEVDHAGELPSTFRTRSDIYTLLQHNRRLFRAKWGREA